MTDIFVVKSTGERQLLDLEKIRRAVLRSGATEEIANKVAAEVERRAHDGITTQRIYNLVRKLLERLSPPASRRYNLRDALIRLGPAGFDFEKYIAALLRAHGFKTELPPILEGDCVTHEVDIIAEKDGHTTMIEAKLRHELGIFITIKDTTHTWVRFLDINDAAKTGKSPYLDQCWIITNSRFSSDSVKFGNCKGMQLVGWNHPPERPLPRWIDEIGLYPVTILRGVNQTILKKFSGANLMLVRELIERSPKDLEWTLGLPAKAVSKLVNEAKIVMVK